MGAATDELLRGAGPELETEREELLRPSDQKIETSGLWERAASFRHTE